MTRYDLKRHQSVNDAEYELAGYQRLAAAPHESDVIHDMPTVAMGEKSDLNIPL